jgi:hypothetical protein
VASILPIQRHAIQQEKNQEGGYQISLCHATPCLEYNTTTPRRQHRISQDDSTSPHVRHSTHTVPPLTSEETHNANKVSVPEPSRPLPIPYTPQQPTTYQSIQITDHKSHMTYDIYHIFPPQPYYSSPSIPCHAMPSHPSMAQHSIAQHSTAQHSTAQHSTAQH